MKNQRIQASDPRSGAFFMRVGFEGNEINKRITLKKAERTPIHIAFKKKCNVNLRSYL